MLLMGILFALVILSDSEISSSPSTSPEQRLESDDPPSNTAIDLLRRYISIRSDHPVYGTDLAVNFWMRESEREEIEGASWSIDPSGKCVHFIGLVPKTSASEAAPIMLLHHGDTVAAVESEWKTPPFTPTWIRTKTDWELHGRGVIDDKGAGMVHWEVLKKIKALKKRSRDVYFVMNCGEEVGDPFGAAAFVHFLIQNLPQLPQLHFELSTAEKLETAKLLKRFWSLPKVGWIWNEGSFGSTTELAPYTLVPVATSQKGYWLGKLTVHGEAGHAALTAKPSPLEALVRSMKRIYDENHSWRWKIQHLHFEMSEMAKVAVSTKPIWQRIPIRIYPRLFFELLGLQPMVTNWWSMALPMSDHQLPNIVQSQASTIVEYRFLGARTPHEIEGHLSSVLKSEAKEPLRFEVKTLDSVPFRRDFFEGVEADVFREVLASYPKVLVTPFITPGITDSRYFRIAGVRAFDLVPFFLTAEQIRAMHGTDERLPYLEFVRAIDIETKVLEKLLQ